MSYTEAAKTTVTGWPDLGPRSSMAQRTADGISAKILDGTYKLGERLVEADLIKQLKVSNSVVREAFHILQGLGIVVTDPFRGRRVFDITNKDEFDNLLITRTSLESLSAYLAAERLDSEWEEKISEAATRFRSAPPTQYMELIRLELDFHRAIWAAAKNEWVARQLSRFFFPVLAFHTVRYEEPGLDIEGVLRGSIEREAAIDHPQGHQCLARAILSRDAAGARRRMIIHLMSDFDHAGLYREFWSSEHSAELGFCERVTQVPADK